jgi:hypothetical protein
MRRLVPLLAAVILAGCLGGMAFQDQTEMSGTFTVQYDLESTTPEVEYRSSTLERGPEWQRQDVEVRFFQEVIDFSVYRHHGTNESFVCYSSNTSRQDDCLFLSERTLWPMLPTADPGVFADDPVSAVKIGPEQVAGRECNRYEVRALSTHYYDALTGGNETAVTERLNVNVNQINASMCIDTVRNYIAQQNMTIDQPGTEVSIAMEALSFEAGAEPEPERDLIVQASCGLRDGRLDILPVDVSGEATVSVNGDNRTVSLERMQRETIRFGDDVASRIDPFFLVEVEDRTYRTGCS